MQLLTEYKTHLIYKKNYCLGKFKNILLNSDSKETFVYKFDLDFNINCYFNDLNILHCQIKLNPFNVYWKIKNSVENCGTYDIKDHEYLNQLDNYKILASLGFSEAVEESVKKASDCAIIYARQLKDHFGDDFEPSGYFKIHIANISQIDSKHSTPYR